MSAYLVDSQTIGLLAQYAVKNGCLKYRNLYDKNLTRDKTVEALCCANLLSLSARYPDTDPARDFAGKSKEEYIADCKAAARKVWSVSPADIIKACGRFDYQACEYDGWPKSIAYKVINAIENNAAQKLPTRKPIKL